MDIKKKREKVIIMTLSVGVFLPIVLFPFCCPKNEDPALIMQLLCFVGMRVTDLLAIFTRSTVLIITTFTIFHVVNYLFLGGIIARLVYLDKKALPKPDNSPEPT